MGYDDRCLRWRKANVPFIINSGVRPSLPNTKIQGEWYITLTELHRVAIASWCRWNEVRVCSAICCSQVGQPPIQCFQTRERIEDVPPQLNLIVVLGSQYAVLAKNVKGVNDEIWSELRAVMLCLLEGWTSSNPGAALIIDTSRSGKMKPANSIFLLLCSRMGANKN